MSDEPLKRIYLRPREADRLRAGHPWVYFGEILDQDESIQDGEWVQVVDSRGHLVGCGFYNSQSKIRVRLLTPGWPSHEIVPEPDVDAFRTRIEAALAIRQRAMPEATSFRVVNAESDFLSGLIVDKYEDVLVIQTTSLGIDQRKPLIVEALKQIFNPVAILEKNDVPSRKHEGLENVSSTLFGESPRGEYLVHLNQLGFRLNFQTGHKTGCYLDQQMNYQRVSELTVGARVLDCFCFLGGFSLHAARAGAAEVVGIDQSNEAVSAATAAARENGFQNCSFICANVFNWLIDRTKKIELTHDDKFDVIILDPPSFTRNRYSVDAAMRGYKEIHLRALKLLRTGGTLVSFCCSHHVDAPLFEGVILQAAYDAHKVLRRVQVYGQSPDHPIIPIIPETEYLKGFAYEVAR